MFQALVLYYIIGSTIYILMSGKKTLNYQDLMNMSYFAMVWPLLLGGSVLMWLGGW